MKQHPILFLPADPDATDRSALEREVREIQVELERSGQRDRFALVTRWAVEPLDLLRELRTLRPTIVHFCGQPGPEAGLTCRAPGGGARAVSAEALAEAFGAAGRSVRLVVLSSCYAGGLARQLLAHVDCVVGLRGPLPAAAARSFAIGFYGGLGEREPVAAAYRQGRAAIGLAGLGGGDRPQLVARVGVDPDKLVITEGDAPTQPHQRARTRPIDFTAERRRHADLVGRADVLALLDEWLLGPDPAGWVVVTGGPGIGKSAVLAAWLARREAADRRVPHHLVRRQVADWDQPEVIAASLAAQIEAAFPGLADPEAKPERRLLELLARVSPQLHTDERLAIVVDGLDEVRADPGDNPLPRFLPHTLPEGIRFLCATRPAYPHLPWLEARCAVRILDLDGARWAASNTEVVRGFWETAAAEYQPPLPADTVAAAIAHADGNVLHAVMLHDALRGLPAAERRSVRIPRGLRALIDEVWDRAAVRPEVRAGLGLLCAAQEALSLDALAALAGWSYEEAERFRRDARQLLLEEPAAWAGADAYRPRHDWVRELIAERLGTAAVRGHHATLAAELATWPPPAPPAHRTYAVRHALAHRVAAEDWAGARGLAADLGYLEARAHAADVYVVEQELADAGARCPEPTAARDLADLARALAHESHWVREQPRGAAGLVWNRLRRSGWTAQDLEARTRVPAAPAFLRVRHAASHESPALERTLDGHGDWVTACAVTPDGRRVVSASADGTLRVWDLDAGRALATLAGHAAGVTACAVAPDGRRALSASVDRTLKVWDLGTGHLLATLAGHADVVTACAFAPDGRRALSASHDRTLALWDPDTGRALARLLGHDGAVTACAIAPDGRRALSASQDRTLRVWDLDAGRALDTLDGHTDVVTACAIAPDGRRAVSASYDDTLRLWDLGGGPARAVLQGHRWVRACAAVPDGRRIISGALDGSLRVWDLATGRPCAALDGHDTQVAACAVTPDGRRLVSASGDRTLKIWDLDATGAAAGREGHAGAVTACATAPGGRCLVTASHDGTLRVWSLASERALVSIRGGGAVLSCAVLPDGRRAIAGAQDGSLAIWDLATGRAITLAGHSASASACAAMPDGRRAVSASDDGTLRVWDTSTGALCVELAGHTDWVLACAVTPDGRRVISGSQDRTVKVWDADTGRLLATLEGHAAGVTACAAAPDGRRAVSASDDGTLRVWDLTTGRPLSTLEGHALRVRACAITPDGRRAVSASFDRTLKVWDLASGRCLFTHRGDAAFRCVAATADRIVAGDGLGTVWFLAWP